VEAGFEEVKAFQQSKYESASLEKDLFWGHIGYEYKDGFAA
jgi:hypothetical protein